MIARRLSPSLVALVATFLVIAPDAPARAIDIERVTSPGGIEAWLVQDHSNPIIAMEFLFDGGVALDPAGKEGLAEMAAALLDEGAGELDSQAFQQRLEDLSIGLSFRAQFDSFGGGLKTLTENRDTAFELLRLALTAPRFDAEAVDRIRSQILTILARNEKNPGRVAGRAWWSAAFPGHPYGRPQDGTPETVKAITAADLKRFVAQRFGRDNLILAVVGDIAPDQLKPLLDKTFGGLPAKAAPVEVADTGPKDTGSVTVIRRPVPQSIVIFGQRGIKRDDPDWYAAHVMNYVLGGGGFISRLTTEVREKRGLAYSISSWLNPLDHAAVISGSVGTQNARVGESIEIIRAEWKRMRDMGISEAELADAKTFLTGSFPLRLDSTDSIASVLVAVRRHNLGIDYLNKRNGFIDAVTVADVQRVAKRLLDPEKLTFVVVGQPENLKGAADPEEAGQPGKERG